MEYIWQPYRLLNSATKKEKSEQFEVYISKRSMRVDPVSHVQCHWINILVCTRRKKKTTIRLCSNFYFISFLSLASDWILMDWFLCVFNLSIKIAFFASVWSSRICESFWCHFVWHVIIEKIKIKKHLCEHLALISSTHQTNLILRLSFLSTGSWEYGSIVVHRHTSDTLLFIMA